MLEVTLHTPQFHGDGRADWNVLVTIVYRDWAAMEDHSGGLDRRTPVSGPGDVPGRGTASVRAPRGPLGCAARRARSRLTETIVVTMEPRDVRFFESAAELRQWFDANHATAEELWLGYYRKGTGRTTLDWSAAVDEALCVGWIDGIRKRLDDDRHVQRFTPRRPRSTWSAVNVAKVASLTAEGRMRPAGLAAFAARSEANTGDLLVRAGGRGLQRRGTGAVSSE